MMSLWRALAWGTFVACQYEAIAIHVKPLPTISKLCKNHKWIPPVIIGGLTAHLYWQSDE